MQLLQNECAAHVSAVTVLDHGPKKQQLLFMCVKTLSIYDTADLFRRISVRQEAAESPVPGLWRTRRHDTQTTYSTTHVFFSVSIREENHSVHTQ